MREEPAEFFCWQNGLLCWMEQGFLLQRGRERDRERDKESERNKGEQEVERESDA